MYIQSIEMAFVIIFQNIYVLYYYIHVLILIDRALSVLINLHSI